MVQIEFAICINKELKKYFCVSSIAFLYGTD